MKFLTIINLTNAFSCCIFAMKQFIEIMKMKKFIKILFFSCLYIALTTRGRAQEWLTHVHNADVFAEMPALGCFNPSFASVRFRNDFGTKEMMYAEVFGVLPVGKNFVLASVSHYGYANYGNMELGVGYGRNFGDRFAMTARIFYLMSHARGYPARHSLCTDFAFACKVSQKLWLAATVYNPFMLRYGVVGQEVIPLRFSVGCTYLPVKKLLMSVLMSKSFPGAWEVGGRFMTQPIAPLMLAVDGSNSRIGVFVGVIYKEFLFSVQASWYYRISVSPEIGGWWFEDPRL